MRKCKECEHKDDEFCTKYYTEITECIEDCIYDDKDFSFKNTMLVWLENFMKSDKNKEFYYKSVYLNNFINSLRIGTPSVYVIFEEISSLCSIIANMEDALLKEQLTSIPMVGNQNAETITNIEGDVTIKM